MLVLTDRSCLVLVPSSKFLVTDTFHTVIFFNDEMLSNCDTLNSLVLHQETEWGKLY